MLRYLLSCTCLFLAASGPAAEPRVVRENIEWLDVWVPDNNAKDLPRVLLIGDSITKGYYAEVEKRLKGTASVSRLATSKSLGDPGLLAEVQLVLLLSKFDVVHFNNGMHGWGYTEAEYAKAFPELLATLRKGAPHAKLIWANTTPVRQADKLEVLTDRTDRVKLRNKAASEFAAAEKIPVNDLFAVVDKPELFSRDGVHLNTKGSAALGEQVARFVQEALKAK